MSTTIEVIGTSKDGYMYAKTADHFSDARDAEDADSKLVGIDKMYVGLGFINPPDAGDKYRFYRMYLYFDTSSIPDGATITAASISLYLVGGLTIIPSGFSLVLEKNTDETYPHATLAVGDFDRTFYTGGGASTPTVYNAETGSKTFTFTSLGKSSWINDQGTSKFVVMSSLDVGYAVPNASMLADFYTQEKGGAYRPSMSITYATPCTVTTGAATVILSSGATGNGNITATGSEAVTQHGVIWNDDGTDPVNLESADNPTTEGAAGGTGTFTSLITGCDAETSYYYRAYATTTAGTSYGDAVQFTTIADSTVFSVTTQATTAPAVTTATANGTIVEDAGNNLAAYGFVYKLGGDPGTPADPTTAANYTDKGGKANPAEGAFTSDLTGLTTESVYFIRAYATYPQETLRPNDAGDETSIASQLPATGAHWEKVDEVVVDDGTRVYTAAASYQRDLYALPAATVVGTISKITVHFRCGFYAIGGVAKASIKSGSTVADGAEKTLTGTWANYSQEWALNPDDGEAWETADIDALQIGVSLNESNCSQVYVVVDYATYTEYGGVDIFRTGTVAQTDIDGETGDGRLYALVQISTVDHRCYQQAIDATSAFSLDTAATTIALSYNENPGIPCTSYIFRGYLYFDTSGLYSATITSVDLKLYVLGSGYITGASPPVQKYGGLQVVHDPDNVYPSESEGSPALALGDFDIDEYTQIATVTAAEMESAASGTGGTVNAWVTISLPISTVNITGLTKVCIMFYDPGEMSGFSQPLLSFHSADGANKPYLDIDYVAPSLPSFPKVNMGDVWVDPLNILVNVGDEWIPYEDLDVNLGDSWVEPT